MLTCPTVVSSWSVGGQAQLKNTIDDETIELFNKLRITSNKHKAVRSGNEQPCDQATSFKETRAKITSFMVYEVICNQMLLVIGLF